MQAENANFLLDVLDVPFTLPPKPEQFSILLHVATHIRVFMQIKNALLYITSSPPPPYNESFRFRFSLVQFDFITVLATDNSCL